MPHLMCVPVDATLDQSGRVEVVLRVVSDDGRANHTMSYAWDFAQDDAANISALKNQAAVEMSAGVGVAYTADHVVVCGGAQ